MVSPADWVPPQANNTTDDHAMANGEFNHDEVPHIPLAPVPVSSQPDPSSPDTVSDNDECMDATGVSTLPKCMTVASSKFTQGDLNANIFTQKLNQSYPILVQ